VTAFTRAVSFQRRFDERLVDRVVPARHGRGLFTSSLPLVRYLNHFSVDVGACAPLEELIGEAERLHAAEHLMHCKISIDDELGAELAPRFAKLGWKHEELLVMAHAGAPDLDTSVVEEVDPAVMEPIWTEGIRSEHMDEGDEAVGQLVAAQHRRRRAVEVRYFAARADGRIASYCELFSDGKTGQIESVMTLERFRGRGLAKAVVTRALAESQAVHDFTFLVADAENWPKELYRKLGFEVAGSIWDFLRPATPAP
jgi:ribosomal protein S18 acetylase RimI-like enzyme